MIGAVMVCVCEGVGGILRVNCRVYCVLVSSERGEELEGGDGREEAERAADEATDLRRGKSQTR